MAPLRPLLRPGLLLALVGGALPLSEARAEEPRPPVRHLEEEEAPRVQGDTVVATYFDGAFLSLRWQPLMLIPALGTVGAEVKIWPQLSAIANLSVGRVKVVDVATLQQVRKTYFEAEFQGRYYFIGGMTGGLYGGAGFTYAQVDSDQLISGPLINLAQGLHVGPNLGANYVLAFGVGIDFGFVLYYRVLRTAPSLPTPDELLIDRASPLRIGASLALTYTF